MTRTRTDKDNQPLAWRRRLALVPLLLAALALIVAACAPEAPGAAETPGLGEEQITPDLRETDILVATEVVAATEGFPGTPVLEETVAALTQTPGLIGTPEGEGTPEAVVTALEPTAEALATQFAGTPGAEATPLPAEQLTQPAVGTPTGEQTLLRSLNLIGMDLMNEAGESLGVVQDVLIDELGNIDFLLVRQPDAPEAQVVVVDWDQIQADVQQEQLRLTGDLAQAPMIDLSAINPDALVIDTEGTDLPNTLNERIRVSQLRQIPAQTVEDVPLGDVEELLFDVTQGQVAFTVVDITQLLDGGTADVAVPWGLVQIDLPAILQDGQQAQAIELNVTPETLTTAPTFDVDQLPAWIDTQDANWYQPLLDFWQTAG